MTPARTPVASPGNEATRPLAEQESLTATSTFGSGLIRHPPPGRPRARTAVWALPPPMQAPRSVDRQLLGRAALVAAGASVATMGLIRPAGPGNSGVADLFIGIAILVCLAWSGFSRVLLRLPYAASMGVFVLGGAIGALVGAFPVAGLVTLAQDVVLVLWCAMLANVARTPARLRTLLQVWIWSAAAYAALVVLARVTGQSTLLGAQLFQFGGRAALMFGDPNMAASYFATSILVVRAAHHPRATAARAGLYALMLVALCLTLSNGGFVTLAIGLGVVAVDMVVRRQRALEAIVAISCVAIAILGLGFTVSRYAPTTWSETGEALRLSVGRSDESLLWRQKAKVYAIELYHDGGPLGQGPASSARRLAERVDAEGIELHDDYLAALVERGVLGAIGILLLVAALLTRAWSATTGSLRVGYRTVVPYPAALLGACVGALVSGVIYEILHFRHLWALFALIAAVHLWARE